MDARTDVYSLGCVLYQTLTKRLPYDKDADVAKMYAHVSAPPPVVTEARPDAPPALDAVRGQGDGQGARRPLRSPPASSPSAAAGRARGASPLNAALDTKSPAQREADRDGV